MIITEFYNTNNNNIFTKPFGVRSLTIIAIGGGGGGSDNIGGNGAMVTATYNNLPLNSFDLNIYIGQGGQAGYSRKGGNGGIGGNRGNGGNGGDEANRYLPNDTLRGGGGGGAVTKIISSENIISIYAGGGGGAGGSSSDGGNGGNAGAYANGDGSNGENGVSVVTDIIRGGGGGTYLSGGSFGHGSGTNTGTYTQLPSTSGSNFSDGGYGGVGEFRAGGGGGGGYTGGGGGGGCGYGGGAGGGAGSSYASSDTVIYSISNNVNYGIGGKAGIPVTYEVPVPTGNDAATDGTSGYVKISYFNPYTVTFNSTNGITNVVIQYSGTALNPPDPVYNGYTFLGWYDAVTGGNEIGLPYTPLADKTLYAQWQGNSVTFNSTNGNMNVTIQYSGTPLNVTNPTYTGYTFLGWYDAVTGGNQISLPYTPLVDKTLYARWRGNHVTFNLINGNMNVVIQYSGTALIIPNPTYTGYTFLGWYDAVTGGNEIGLPYIPLVDKTLYAQWRGNSVTFNSTNGITNVAIQYSGTGLNPSDPVYNNYTFTGWYDAVTGGNKINLPYIPLVDNGTLYAHWVGDKIIFYSNNGTPNFTETFERGIILIPTAPTYNGYTFLGWYDAVTGGNEINLNTHIFTEASINLYAQWQGNTVIFQPNNNNPADIRTIQFSGTALNTSNPSFNSYIFEGWYDENGNNINLPYTPLVDNITIYAYWRNYDVTFNPENYRPNIRVEYKRIPLNSPVVKKAGFFFEGWYDENGNKINLSTFVPSSDVIFYAKWTGYTVTFNVRNRISVETVYNGTEFNPGNISKSDFFFEGWNYEEVGETVINLRSFIPYSNTELYAQFFNSCSSTPPDPPNLWSRATLSCVDYDYEQLAMRRKAEVLKYKGNQNPLTKKQQWSRNVNGNGPLGKKVWATQNILGSNPNVFNLPQVGNTLILCPNNDTDNNIYNLSSTLIGNIDEFGRSVSISGDGNTLAISSFEEQTVYVYTKNINNSWSVAATLYEPTIDSFGSSLQLSYDGNTLITGSYIYPLYPIEYGRAYIYEKIASVWTQTFISTGTNTEQRFGKSVSINNDGSVIAVGSQYDNNVTYNGKIEVFERNGSHWNSAAPAYTLIATGLNFEQLSDTGIFLNGNGNFISATTDANKIYVYKKSGLSWSSGNTSQTLTISSDDNVCFDTNANYLCIGTLSGNISYVYKYNTTTNLFEAQQSFNNLDGTSSTVIIISPDGKYIAIGLPNVNSNTGVVYIYKIINNTWILIQKIYGDRINGLFGISLSFDNDGYTLAIGASSYDAEPGKVYIYFRNGTIITNNIKCEPSSSSDVPGNSILCYDPSVPLVNYLPPPRTYLAGGTKWPQSSWKPGDNGFPRGKKGMRMLFQ